MYYNKKGEKIDIDEYIKLTIDKNYKIIKQEELANGKKVSTVWLGMDYGFNERKPVIFETMVFLKGGYMDEYCERYTTKKEALAGHKRIAKKYDTTTK